MQSVHENDRLIVDINNNKAPDINVDRYIIQKKKIHDTLNVA